LVGRWAICSGAGADSDTLREAKERKIETLIVGEGAHWTAVDAEENNIVIVYAGHYATETLGVQALAKALAAEFTIPWHFIPTPTGT
jgi:putative NIF3 family GTP cyclohydrolase 1 type 2